METKMKTFLNISDLYSSTEVGCMDRLKIMFDYMCVDADEYLDIYGIHRMGQMKDFGDIKSRVNYLYLEEDVEKLTRTLVSDYALALTKELDRVNKLRVETHETV
jgi:hypothetical protein